MCDIDDSPAPKRIAEETRFVMPSNVDSEGTTDKLTDNQKRDMINSEQL